MQSITRFGYVYFVATYLCLMAWLYQAVSNQFEFCIASHHPTNLLGLAAGIFGTLTLISYGKHEVGDLRLFGVITFVFGFLPFIAVVYRFFAVTTGCAV